jgi:sigma-B regulation protein RsbU (phosphoserine phosphatase)
MNKKRPFSNLSLVHIALSGGSILILTIASLLFFKKDISLVDQQFSNQLTNSSLLFIYLIVALALFVISIFLINLINSRLANPFSDIVATIKANDRYKTVKAVDDDEAELISRYIRTLENQIDFYEKKFEKIVTENKGFEKDLKLASRLQRNLFPANSPFLTDHKKFEIHAYAESAYEVGGDLYDCFLIDDDHLLIAIADVAGKGIAASLYMIYTHTLLRSLVKPGKKVSEIVNLLNNQLNAENISDMFVTLFLGILNLNDGLFEYCNAAHCIPCVITTTGSVSELPETHGIPVGIYPDRVYKSTAITLNEGDQLFLYTDGLTDSIDENGLKFSMDVLKYNLMGSWFLKPSEVINRIIQRIDEFRGTAKPVDDLTLLALKYLPANMGSEETGE